MTESLVAENTVVDPCNDTFELMPLSLAEELLLQPSDNDRERYNNLRTSPLVRSALVFTHTPTLKASATISARPYPPKKTFSHGACRMSSPTITPEAKRLSKEIAELKRQIDTENAMIKMYEDSVSKTKTSYLAAGQAPSARLLEREKIRTQIRENSSAMRLCIQSTMSQHNERLRALEQRLASLRKAP